MARRLAALVGCGAATLGVSTLHLFFDWFGTTTATRRTVILWDNGIYAVGRWGVERAVTRGAHARPFHHFDAASLAAALEGLARDRLRPIIVTDGYCVGCGRAAPLEAYHLLARRAGGVLVVDDTQSLGLTDGGCPLGTSAGGGGSLRRVGIEDGGVVWIASLAKAFGAPVAALGGAMEMVARFEAESETRVHASAPSAASIAAASRALALNERFGATLRQRLLARVRRFRGGLARGGLAATGGAHPVQLIDPIPGIDPAAICATLSVAGVRAVPVRRCRRGDSRAAIGFVITAAHEERDIDHATAVLAATVANATGWRRHLDPKEAHHVQVD